MIIEPIIWHLSKQYFKMNFTISTTINCSVNQIFECWLSSKGHTDMTGGEATASAEEGAEFSAWDGYIWGKNLIVENNKRIVQSWRTSEFKEGEPDSQIEVLFSEVNGQSTITLHHTDLPADGGHYKKGWEDHYFEPMTVFFEKL